MYRGWSSPDNIEVYNAYNGKRTEGDVEPIPKRRGRALDTVTSVCAVGQIDGRFPARAVTSSGGGDWVYEII